MSEEDKTFELPRRLERILANLSQYYAVNKKSLLQNLVVNSTYRVDEGADYDRWDGGQWGHAIHLRVPPQIYYLAMDQLGDITAELTRDVNRLSSCPNEYISTVILELEDDASLVNWREDSGVLVRPSAPREVPSDTELNRLWEPHYLRVFLSHKSEYKMETAQLKEALLWFGITSFVAHEDIEPTREWQDEIEKALFSMEVMMPLLTPGFSDSRWTDQEIGVALGSGVPIVPVRLGSDPYGFIGKYQAVSGMKKTADQLASDLFEVLFSESLGIGPRVSEALVARFERSASFDHANRLMSYLRRIRKVPLDLVHRLELAPKQNAQVEGAWKVERGLKSLIKQLRDE